MDRTKLRAELVRDEGYSLVSYLDTEGNWTVGIGHLIGKIRRIDALTNAEVEAFYEADARVAQRIAEHLVVSFSDLVDVRQRAVVNMAFNLGESRLFGFHQFLGAMAASDWHTAALEMLDSKWAKQVGPRATRLAAAIRTGVE